MNTRKGYVLIMDHNQKERTFLVQTRGTNGKILSSSVENLTKIEIVINNMQKQAEVFGGSLKKTDIRDATDRAVFFTRGIAHKKYKPRS